MKMLDWVEYHSFPRITGAMMGTRKGFPASWVALVDHDTTPVVVKGPALVVRLDGDRQSEMASTLD